MSLTEQNINFFDTFGYLVLRGALADDVGWITDEFEAVFEGVDVVHDGSQRTSIVPFIDQRERLCTLLDHPVVEDVLAKLLGPNANYLGGDGNFYTGDTGWHPDGSRAVGRFIKLVMYLDPVRADTGCLRVIPGSHRLDWQARQAGAAQDVWGIRGSDVPCMPLESDPGDLVVFNHNTFHASFGGSSARRMFTLNCSSHAGSDEELQELMAYMDVLSQALGMSRVHSDVMHTTASPQRMTHLRQVIEHENRMAAAGAKASADPSIPWKDGVYGKGRS